jgi:hypothetical protein
VEGQGCLSPETIICDHVGFVRLCAHLGDPSFPALEFFRLVRIFVMVIAVFGLKPLFVVASMQAHVNDWSRTMKRTPFFLEHFFRFWASAERNSH